MVMTAEPKFVPEEAVDIALDEGSSCSVRLIDCVGYMIPGATGQMGGREPPHGLDAVARPRGDDE